MVGDVAEVLLHVVLDQLEPVHRQLSQRLEERLEAVVQLQDRALQLVDALDGVRPAAAGEDLPLHLVDVVLQAPHDGLVVVDDVVDDGVQHGARPVLRAGRRRCSSWARTAPSLEAAPWRTCTRNPSPEEGLDLPELDVLQLLEVAGGLQHHEEAVVVLLELGALVGLEGVLDGELVEVERLADGRELLSGRLEQPDPDEAVGLGQRGVGGRRVEASLPGGHHPT